jgi:hypothetical protein
MLAIECGRPFQKNPGRENVFTEIFETILLLVCTPIQKAMAAIGRHRFSRSGFNRPWTKLVYGLPRRVM